VWHHEVVKYHPDFSLLRVQHESFGQNILSPLSESQQNCVLVQESCSSSKLLLDDSVSYGGGLLAYDSPFLSVSHTHRIKSVLKRETLYSIIAVWMIYTMLVRSALADSIFFLSPVIRASMTPWTFSVWSLHIVIIFSSISLFSGVKPLRDMRIFCMYTVFFRTTSESLSISMTTY